MGFTNEENETKEVEGFASGHCWLPAEEGQLVRTQVFWLPVQHSLASCRIKKETQRECYLDNSKEVEKWLPTSLVSVMFS